MSPSKKVWVINDAPAARKKPVVATRARAVSTGRAPAPAVNGLADRSRPIPEPTQPAGRPSVLHVVAAYTLGSAAPFIVQQGRHGGIWAGISLFSFSIWSLVLSQWGHVQTAFSHGWLPFHVWLVGMGLTAIAGITSWSRAILIVSGEFSSHAVPLHRWVRSALGVGLVGLVVPGFGLMLAGRPRQAAFASWVSGMVTLSVLVLWRARLVWEAHQQSASAGLGSLGLERLLLGCVIVAMLGCLACVIHAYEGARLANRIPLRASMQGPWWAVALLLSAAAFFMTFDPAQRAADLDHLATSMRRAGLQYIPLQVQLASLRLDPSNLVTRIQVAELYDELGRVVDAAEMREDVRRRWDIYAEWMQEGPQAELTSNDASPEDTPATYRSVDFLLPIEP